MILKCTRHVKEIDSGTAHTVTVTSANKADIGELPAFLRKEDEVIFGYADGLHQRHI